MGPGPLQVALVGVAGKGMSALSDPCYQRLQFSFNVACMAAMNSS
jgi:hypothetical protein